MQLPFDLGPLWRKDDRFFHFQEDIVPDGKTIPTQWISFQPSDLNNLHSLLECLDDDSNDLGIIMRIFDSNNTMIKFENMLITVSLKDTNNNLVSTQSYLDTSQDFFDLAKIMKHQLKIAMATEMDMNFLSETRFKSCVDTKSFEVIRSPRANSEFSDRSGNTKGMNDFENLRVASSDSSTSIASTKSSTSNIIPENSNKYENYTFEIKIVFDDQIFQCSQKLKWYLFVATKINFEPMTHISRSKTLETFTKNFLKHKYIPLSTFSNTAINEFCYTRFDTPIRFKKCNHVECFDISDFMKTNENNLTPVCPVCKIRAKWSDVAICEWTATILDRTDDDEHKVLLNCDGSFVSPLNSTDCYGSECRHFSLLKKV